MKAIRAYDSKSHDLSICDDSDENILGLYLDCVYRNLKIIESLLVPDILLNDVNINNLRSWYPGEIFRVTFKDSFFCHPDVILQYYEISLIKSKILLLQECAELVLINDRWLIKSIDRWMESDNNRVTIKRIVGNRIIIMSGDEAMSQKIGEQVKIVNGRKIIIRRKTNEKY